MLFWAEASFILKNRWMIDGIHGRSKSRTIREIWFGIIVLGGRFVLDYVL